MTKVAIVARAALLALTASVIVYFRSGLLQTVPAVGSKIGGVRANIDVASGILRRMSPDLALRIDALSPELVQLGSLLFQDARLSRSSSISCASCHQPSVAFSDSRKQSIGEKGPVTRNAPVVFNRGLAPRLFWDGRASSLKEQARGPLLCVKEMGFSESSYLARVVTDGDRDLRSFLGASPVLERICAALAEFQISLVSVSSAFDQHEWDGASISDKVQEGARLFRGKAGCSQCHTGWNFSDEKYHDIGLITDDLGLAGMTGVEHDRRRFKTPTLRNISRTAPYMHDGSFATIREVLDHYNAGGARAVGRSILVRPLDLTLDELDAMEAFLGSLEGPVVCVARQ